MFRRCGGTENSPHLVLHPNPPPIWEEGIRKEAFALHIRAHCAELKNFGASPVTRGRAAASPLTGEAIAIQFNRSLRPTLPKDHRGFHI